MSQTTVPHTLFIFFKKMAHQNAFVLDVPFFLGCNNKGKSRACTAKLMIGHTFFAFFFKKNKIFFLQIIWRIKKPYQLIINALRIIIAQI